MAIILRSRKEIERLRASNRVVMSVMAELKRGDSTGCYHPGIGHFGGTDYS